MTGTTLPRTWLAAIHPMITGRTEPVLAGHTARLAAAHGCLVQVCSYCITPAHRAVLAGHGNVSHGACRPCADALIAELEGRAA